MNADTRKAHSDAQREAAEMHARAARRGAFGAIMAGPWVLFAVLVMAPAATVWVNINHDPAADHSAYDSCMLDRLSNAPDGWALERIEAFCKYSTKAE